MAVSAKQDRRLLPVAQVTPCHRYCVAGSRFTGACYLSLSGIRAARSGELEAEAVGQQAEGLVQHRAGSFPVTSMDVQAASGGLLAQLGGDAVLVDDECLARRPGAPGFQRGEPLLAAQRLLGGDLEEQDDLGGR